MRPCDRPSLLVDESHFLLSTNMSNAHPNFPDGLDIKVNVNLKSRELAAKDLPDIAQPVEEYGIAGRVW